MFDQALVTIDEFRGIFANYEENTVPPNHFKDGLNLEFGPGFFAKRKGLSAHLTISDVRRIRVYTIPGAANRLLILTGESGGNGSPTAKLYDSTNLVTPILTIAGMTDFSAISLFGRAYISPHDGKIGLEDEVVYVYDGTGVARPAAGPPPEGFDLTLSMVTPTTLLDDIVAPVVPANGVQVLTSSPYVFPTSSTIKFVQAGGAVTALTITVVGTDSGGDAATEIYINPVASAGPLTYTTGELWKVITSITISGLVGAGGTIKVEATGLPAGKVELGYHVVAVVYETDSGFLTKPGPLNNYGAILARPKNRAIRVQGIPAAPGTGIAKTHIVVSKLIEKKRFTGDPDGYELFFVPKAFGGEVAIGTTETTINFYDADLLDSADYLLDNLSEIPAAVNLFATSKGRLLTGGEFDNETIIRGSKGGEPEAVSATDGFVISDPGSGGVRNFAEYRDSLYIFKSHATLITQDNGDLLSTWTINLIDRAIGAECHSIGTVLSTEADVLDTLIVADRSGLMAFNGAYGEQPLSWKIKAIWDSVDDAFFHLTQVSIDPVNKLILICFANDEAAGVVNVLLMGDYSEGLDWQNIKWCEWRFESATGSFIPETVVSEFDNTTGKTTFKVGFRNISGIFTYQYDSQLNNDGGIAFPAHWETYKYSASESGAVTQITGMRIKITGFGEVALSLLGSQDKPTEVQSPFQTPTSSSGNILQKLNFVEDDISIKGAIDAIDENFQVSKIWLFGTELWGEKPSGLEFDLKQNLISYWDLETASGSRVDAHGSNDLTDNNTVLNATGIVGNAALFDIANTEYLSRVSNATLQTGDIDFALACWIFISAYGSNPGNDTRTIISKRNTTGGPSTAEYFIGVSSTIIPGQIFFNIYNSAGSLVGIVESTHLLTLSTWTFIVPWHDSVNNTVNIQINDFAPESASTTGIITVTATPFNIGVMEGPSLAFNGRIDEVGFWKRILNPHEREYLYNQGAGRNYANL